MNVPDNASHLFRKTLGYCIAIFGFLAMLYLFWKHLRSGYPQPVYDAFVAGCLAAGATGLGALPVAFSSSLSERVQDTLFGFGAGVMLAACSFSLIVPGLNAAETLGHTSLQSGLIVGIGILVGAASLLLMERLLPHEHFIKGVEGQNAQLLKRTWLFVFAILLHNLPEGLAIGVAYAGSNPIQAGGLATGIAIQDIPEGLVVAVALVAAGYSRTTSILIAISSGLIEPIGALLGAIVVGVSAELLPWGLAFAAGAMLFVISHEIIPESHRKGHEASATSGLMIGFVLMMLLDTSL